MASHRGHGPGEPRVAPSSASPPFADRTEAGVLLGAAVREAIARWGATERVRGSAGRPAARQDEAGRQDQAIDRARVFALPRGGVPVAVGVARALGAPLDVLMVRKIGHPGTPELGLGAIAEDGRGGALAPYFDQELLREAGLFADELADVVDRERAELARRVAVYRPPATAGPAGRPAGGEPAGGGGAADLTGQLAIVVDDGLATGVTARAALRAVRARGPAGTMLAVPVAAPAAVAAMKKETDEVVTLVTPRRFLSVGEWYVDFGQLTDADVLTLLAAIP